MDVWMNEIEVLASIHWTWQSIASKRGSSKSIKTENCLHCTVGEWTQTHSQYKQNNTHTNMQTQWNDVGIEVIAMLIGQTHTLTWKDTDNNTVTQTHTQTENLFLFWDTRCEVFYEFGTWRNTETSKTAEAKHAAAVNGSSFGLKTKSRTNRHELAKKKHVKHGKITQNQIIINY